MYCITNRDESIFFNGFSMLLGKPTPTFINKQKVFTLFVFTELSEVNRVKEKLETVYMEYGYKVIRINSL